MVDINRMAQMCYLDEPKHRADIDLQKYLTDLLLLSPDVKLHNHNAGELSLDLMSY